jgi:hypothetical protein
VSNHAASDYATQHSVTATPIFDELRDEIGIDIADLLPQASTDTGEDKEIRAVG